MPALPVRRRRGTSGVSSLNVAVTCAIYNSCPHMQLECVVEELYDDDSRVVSPCLFVGLWCLRVRTHALCDRYPMGIHPGTAVPAWVYLDVVVSISAVWDSPGSFSFLTPPQKADRFNETAARLVAAARFSADSQLCAPRCSRIDGDFELLVDVDNTHSHLLDRLSNITICRDQYHIEPADSYGCRCGSRLKLQPLRPQRRTRGWHRWWRLGSSPHRRTRLLHLPAPSEAHRGSTTPTRLRNGGRPDRGNGIAQWHAWTLRTRGQCTEGEDDVADGLSGLCAYMRIIIPRSHSCSQGATFRVSHFVQWYT